MATVFTQMRGDAVRAGGLTRGAVWETPAEKQSRNLPGRAGDSVRVRGAGLCLAPRVKILFIGDIVGEPGRRAVHTLLPKLREQHGLDFVIANGENSAGGN